MGIIDDILISDASAFVDPDFMPGVESVVYTRRGTVDAVPVNAQVFRSVPQAVLGLASSGFAQPGLEVFIAVGQGITAIDTGGDSVTVARKFGGTPEPLPVKSIIKQDAGGWHLKLF